MVYRDPAATAKEADQEQLRALFLEVCHAKGVSDQESLRLYGVLEDQWVDRPEAILQRTPDDWVNQLGLPLGLLNLIQRRLRVADDTPGNGHLHNGGLTNGTVSGPRSQPPPPTSPPPPHIIASERPPLTSDSAVSAPNGVESKLSSTPDDKCVPEDVVTGDKVDAAGAAVGPGFTEETSADVCSEEDPPEEKRPAHLSNGVSPSIDAGIEFSYGLLSPMESFGELIGAPIYGPPDSMRGPLPPRNQTETVVQEAVSSQDGSVTSHVDAPGPESPECRRTGEWWDGSPANCARGWKDWHDDGNWWSSRDHREWRSCSHWRGEDKWHYRDHGRWSYWDSGRTRFSDWRTSREARGRFGRHLQVNDLGIGMTLCEVVNVGSAPLPLPNGTHQHSSEAPSEERIGMAFAQSTSFREETFVDASGNVVTRSAPHLENGAGVSDAFSSNHAKFTKAYYLTLSLIKPVALLNSFILRHNDSTPGMVAWEYDESDDAGEICGMRPAPKHGDKGYKAHCSFMLCDVRKDYSGEWSATKKTAQALCAAMILEDFRVDPDVYGPRPFRRATETDAEEQAEYDAVHDVQRRLLARLPAVKLPHITWNYAVDPANAQRFQAEARVPSLEASVSPLSCIVVPECFIGQWRMGKKAAARSGYLKLQQFLDTLDQAEATAEDASLNGACSAMAAPVVGNGFH